jgi:tyrosine-protein kinase Etk/Wzc
MEQDQNKQEETIDIKALILKYTQYWYYFLLSILFFGFIAFLNNRFTVPEYSVSTTLLIRDDNNTQLGAENLIEGLELFSGKKNLTNEIVILNSYSINEKVIEELGLGLSYFQHGFFQTNELFENAPFIVQLDSTHSQIIETEFEVTIIDENSFNLTVSTEDLFPYNLVLEKFDKTVLANIDIDETHQFDKKIVSDYYAFTISKSLFFKEDEIANNNKTYSFKLHETDKLAQNLITSVTINPINKETSILKLNIKASNPKKNINILNKLTEIYIRGGLDEKNIMAINTIYFIDEQLRVINDSLTFIENQLEAFRIKNPNLELVDKEYGTYFQKQKLDNTLSEQSVNIKYYQSLLSYLKNDNNANSIVSPTSMGISNPELNTLINQLLQLYAKKGDLQLTTTNKNPAYTSVISQIEQLIVQLLKM